MVSLFRRIAIGMIAASTASCAFFTSETESRSGPCPPGMAHITTDSVPARSYCIDKWEASIVELREDGREVPHPPYEPVKKLRVKAVTKPGVVPQGYISKNEAEAACKAAHKRLCTGEEWQLACRGKKSSKFPYGDERKKGYCNDSGRAPLLSLYPQLGDGVFASAKAMNDPRINQAPNTVAKTGAFSRCRNEFGVYDMVGNLHEWTAEVNGSRGVFRGGYYQDTHRNGDGCTYKTVVHGVDYHDYSTGFRCCADPR
mgnify:CR=1 FL=1